MASNSHCQLLLCLLALPLAARAQGDSKQLVAQLGSTEYQQRYQAYRSLLVGRSKDALPLLVKALPGFGISSQSYGILLVQRYPSSSSTPALQELMRASSPFLQLASAVVLYQRGNKSKTVEVMVKALDSATGSTTLASSMLARITYIKEARVHARVRELIKPGTSITILDSALYHLLNAKDRGAIAYVIQVLDHEAQNEEGRANPALRALCAAFLVGLGEMRYADVLADAISQGDVRFSRLRRHLDKAPRLDRRVLDAILEVVKDESVRTYQLSAAIAILGKHGHGRALRVIRKLIKHENSSVAKAAAAAVTAIGGSMNTGTLVKMLAEPNDEIALMAADLLRKLDNRTGLPRVLEIVKRGGPQKADAVRILGGYRVQAAVRPLIDALMDRDFRVRSNAFSALTQVMRSLFPYRRLALAKTGYGSNRSAAQRKEATKKILTWWQEQRLKKR